MYFIQMKYFMTFDLCLTEKILNLDLLYSQTTFESEFEYEYGCPTRNSSRYPKARANPDPPNGCRQHKINRAKKITRRSKAKQRESINKEKNSKEIKEECKVDQNIKRYQSIQAHNLKIKQVVEKCKDFDEDVKMSLKEHKRNRSQSVKDQTLDEVYKDTKFRGIQLDIFDKRKPRETELDFEISIHFSSESFKSIKIPTQFNCIGKVNFPVEEEVRIKECDHFEVDYKSDEDNYRAKSEIVLSVKSIELTEDSIQDENIEAEYIADRANTINTLKRNIGYYLDAEENRSISDTSFNSEVSQVPLFSSRKTIQDLNCSDTGEIMNSFNQIFTPDLEQYSTNFLGREQLGSPNRSTGIGIEKEMNIHCSTNDHSECKSNYSNISQYNFPMNPMRSIYENIEIYEEIRKHLGDKKPYQKSNQPALQGHKRQMFMMTEKINNKRIEINTVDYNIKKLNKKILHLMQKADKINKLILQVSSENEDLKNEVVSIAANKLLMHRFN